MRRFSHLIDRAVGAGLARKAQRQTEFFRYRCVDRDRREDAHGRTGREATERLRAKLHPVPFLALLVIRKPVDLIEVIIGRHVPRIGFAHRRLHRSKVRAVVLGAGDENDPFQMRCGAVDGRDRVDQHVAVRGGIGGKIRRASGAGLKCRVEDVGDVRQRGELAVRLFGIEQIDGNVPVARAVRRRSPRQTDHLPVASLHEPLDDVTPDDPERANHDRFLLHPRLPQTVWRATRCLAAISTASAGGQGCHCRRGRCCGLSPRRRGVRAP